MSKKQWRALAVSRMFASVMFASVVFCAAATAADGDIDASFGDAGTALVAADGTETIAIVPADAMALPDGKLLFAGARHRLIPENPPFEPEIRAMLLRMNSDGSADASFGDSSIPGLVVLPDLVPGTRIQTLDAMTRLEDGSIVGVGTAVADGPTQGFVVKLGADGALDASFGDQGVARLPDYYLHAVAIDSQGRIVACGEHLLDYRYTSAVVRLDAGGNLDDTFGLSGVVLIPWSDEKQAGYLSDVALTADDGILAGGRFAAYGPGVSSDFAIARLDADGAFDPAFGGSGWRVFHDLAGTSTTNGIDRLALLADGSIVFAGYHAAGDEGFRGVALGRLTVDGESDAAFGDPATPGYLYADIVPGGRAVNASALAIQADGKPIVSVTYFSATDRQHFLALRATADGQLDPAFATAGIFDADLGTDPGYSDVRAMALQADGRIVLGGRIVRTFDPPLTDMAAMRLVNDIAAPDEIFASGFDG